MCVCAWEGAAHSALACHVVSKSELTTTALGSVDPLTLYGSVKTTSTCAARHQPPASLEAARLRKARLVVEGGVLRAGRRNSAQSLHSPTNRYQQACTSYSCSSLLNHLILEHVCLLRRIVPHSAIVEGLLSLEPLVQAGAGRIQSIHA